MTKQPSPQEQITVDLMHIMRHVKKRFSTHSPHHEMSMVQMQALLSVKHGKATMKDVADDLCVALPTATVLIDKLVRDEYIDRSHDKADRRIVRLALTKKGKDLLRLAFKQRVQDVASVLTIVSEKDRTELQRILHTIYEHLIKEGN